MHPIEFCVFAEKLRMLRTKTDYFCHILNSRMTRMMTKRWISAVWVTSSKKLQLYRNFRSVCFWIGVMCSGYAGRNYSSLLKPTFLLDQKVKSRTFTFQKLLLVAFVQACRRPEERNNHYGWANFPAVFLQEGLKKK